MLFSLFKRRKVAGPAAGPPQGGASPPGGQRPAQRRSVGASDTEALLKRLEWTVIKRLDGLLQGDHRTLMRGTGLDLADLREYQHHDDVRHIDWNVTARLQTPHVRVFTEDREMAAWFLLDLSPSVDFGSGAQRKRELLQGFVGVIARLISRHGNRVGAMLYGQRAAAVDAVLPARGGRTQVLRLLNMLNTPAALRATPSRGRHQPSGEAGPAVSLANSGSGDSSAEAFTGPTDLGQLLQRAAVSLRQRCTVFVVSDFISEPGWERPLGELARRHDVVAVRLLDPLERELPDLGVIPMRDAETGEQLLVDTHDAGFRRRFAAIAARRETQLRDALARAGVDALELSTGDELFSAVRRFVELRRQRLAPRPVSRTGWREGGAA